VEPPPPPAPPPDPGKYNLAEDRTKGNWDDDIWTAEVPPSPSAKKPDAKSKAEGKFIGPGDVMTPEQKSKIGFQTGHLVKRTGKSEGAFMGPGDDPSFFESDKFNPSKPTSPAATPPLSKGNYAVPGPSIHEQQATRVRVQAKRHQAKMDLEHGKKVRQTEEQRGPLAPGPVPGP